MKFLTFLPTHLLPTDAPSSHTSFPGHHQKLPCMTFRCQHRLYHHHSFPSTMIWLCQQALLQMKKSLSPACRCQPGYSSHLEGKKLSLLLPQHFSHPPQALTGKEDLKAAQITHNHFIHSQTGKGEEEQAKHCLGAGSNASLPSAFTPCQGTKPSSSQQGQAHTGGSQQKLGYL